MEPESNEILCYSFNQELNCVAIGMKRSFHLFRCEDFALLYSYTKEGASIVEMAYTTNIISIVGTPEGTNFSPQKLTIWTADTDVILCERSFLFKIEAVKVNKSRMVVCLKDKIHIYNTKNIKFLQEISAKLCLTRMALSPNSENCYLVYCGETEGTVYVYDAQSLTHQDPIEAHDGAIVKLCINSAGNRIATTSIKGTVIRVFSLPKGEKLYSFRRGLSETQIFSLNFSMNSNYLSLSSISGTIHIFDLGGTSTQEDVDEDEKEIAPQETSIIGSIASTFTSLFGLSKPGDVGLKRACMTIKAPQFNTPNICAISQDNSFLFIFLRTGVWLTYKLDIPNKVAEFDKTTTVDKGISGPIEDQEGENSDQDHGIETGKDKETLRNDGET